MSFENAESNLKEFGKELGLEGLEFDENKTCILGIDDEFSMHLTYEPNSDRMYLYSPLLDGLPKEKKILLKLYQILLEGSMLGGQMAGGGAGVAVKEELILLHCTLPMGLSASPNDLRAFAPLYVETIERWRKIVEDVCAGRDPDFQSPTEAAAAAQSGGKGGGSGGLPGGGLGGGLGGPFVKV